MLCPHTGQHSLGEGLKNFFLKTVEFSRGCQNWYIFHTHFFLIFLSTQELKIPHLFLIFFYPLPRRWASFGAAIVRCDLLHMRLDLLQLV